MISTTTLQPPTNRLYIIMSVHASTVIEIIVSIIVMSLMIRIVLYRTRLSLKKRGTVLQVVVAMVEDILVVVSIIRAKAIINRTSLECPTLPMSIVIRFSVLMEFGWLF